MKKYIFLIIIALIIIGSFVYYYFFKNNNTHAKNSKENNSIYTALKTTTTDDNSNNSINSEPKDITLNNNENEEISSFSTKIIKDTKARFSNIELACSTLNNSIVKSGETFSLWNVLGCPTKEKGYKKAKTFRSNGSIVKAYGGGICQISTTLYNAVLNVDDLEVTERHEHSRDVNYIKDGKDASVSYNSADFKFINRLDYDIKIEAFVEDNKVKIKLLRI